VKVSSPDLVLAAGVWASAEQTLEITTARSMIEEGARVEMLVYNVRTPSCVYDDTSVTNVTSFDSAAHVIDDKTSIAIASVSIGALGGGLIWTPAATVAGTKSDTSVSFVTVGGIAVGGRIEVVLSDVGWSMKSTPNISFSTPSSVAATASWTEGTRLLVVTTTSGDIAEGSTVVLTVKDTLTPPSVALEGVASIATFDGATGRAIDIGTLVRRFHSMWDVGAEPTSTVLYNDSFGLVAMSPPTHLHPSAVTKDFRHTSRAFIPMLVFEIRRGSQRIWADSESRCSLHAFACEDSAPTDAPTAPTAAASCTQRLILDGAQEMFTSMKKGQVKFSQLAITHAQPRQCNDSTTRFQAGSYMYCEEKDLAQTKIKIETFCEPAYCSERTAVRTSIFATTSSFSASWIYTNALNGSMPAETLRPAQMVSAGIKGDPTYRTFSVKISNSDGMQAFNSSSDPRTTCSLHILDADVPMNRNGTTQTARVIENGATLDTTMQPCAEAEKADLCLPTIAGSKTLCEVDEAGQCDIGADVSFSAVPGTTLNVGMLCIGSIPLAPLKSKNFKIDSVRLAIHKAFPLKIHPSSGGR
jgi:hypothetical protein